MSPRYVATVCLGLALATASLARAESAESRPDYWARGSGRRFASADLEVGFPYARTKLAIGVGKPHHAWAGLEIMPVTSIEGLGAYFGARGVIPHLELRLGVRYFDPFERTLLARRTRYSRLDIEEKTGRDGTYTAREAELRGDVPLPGGRILAVATAYYIPAGKTDLGLYEESLHVVMDPPWVWRARLGYQLVLGRHDAIKVGPAVDLIGLPGRDAYVVRVGGIASVDVSATLAVQATFIPVVHSPDSIGLAGADFTQLGVRFRWATGPLPR